MNKPTDALNCYKEVMRLKPHDANAYFMIGKTLWDLGYLEKAVKFYNIAIDIKPDFFKAYNNLSKVLREQRNR